MKEQKFKKCSSTPRARVLIVDDEPMVGELLQDMLRLMGYAPRSCGSALEALQILEHERFQIILSDYRMPQMSGPEFYDEVLSRNPEVASRMIFLTGDAASDDTQFFLRSTGSIHLAKPFHFNKVKQILDEAVARSERPFSPA